MEEPSVLDYVKSKLAPWRGQKIVIPPAEPAPEDLAAPQEPLIAGLAERESALPAAAPFALPWSAAIPRVLAIPWRSFLALALGLLAQLSLEPSPNRTWKGGAILYLLGAGFVVLAWWRGEWQPSPIPESQARQQPLTLRIAPFFLGGVLSLLAFADLGGNLFTRRNLALWLLSLACFVWALWLPQKRELSLWQRLSAAFTGQQVSISPWTMLLLAVSLLILFFRVYQIQQTPPEMVSDHAEKLLDVWDVVNGQTSIFFPRNTGREALQMYLTAAIVLLFNSGYSFLSLKIGAVLAGLLTLPYIYLLGKEVGSRRIGLLALVFAGIAYWPNVISRVGLRFPLYPLFVAPALYYLLRGLRTSNRNDFILAGLALGIGLHGYTPIRILPFVILAAVGLYLLHRQPAENRRQAILGLFVLGIISLVVFLPLLRFALENPDLFGYRSFTRLGSVERPLPGPAGEIFISNLWRAVSMFAWNDGEIWVNSIPGRPALDVVSAAFFYLGTALLLARYLRQRHWVDLFLLLSVPLLMMPSILSLAFPAENPALNRMGGAIVPVFLIVGIAMDGLLSAISNRLGGWLGSAAAWGVMLLLLFGSARQNFDLVFRQYRQLFEQSSWNTLEMGGVVRDFADSVGSPDTAWVLAFPHWVDTRLVGMNAGYPLRDYAIWPENLANTLSEPRAKLFLVKPEDSAGLDALRQLYPQGALTTYTSAVESHDFLLYFVPPQSEP